MKTILIYPIPFDQWQTFKPFVERFTNTFREFPPGEDYVLWAMCCWGEPSDSVREMFYGIKTRFVPYYQNGCDIGSAQAAARTIDEAFLVCFTSRCYFHRKGWLARYLQAFNKHGDGLYGPFASWESGKPHICTRAYALTAAQFGTYPHDIDTREKGQLFEVGEWSISDWFRAQNLPLIQVLWDNEQTLNQWRKWKGIWRCGEQQACLLWDKHTDHYRDADEETKLKLQAMTDPPSYSQHGEDRWILENVDLPSIGVFVEVGAYDGATASNTLLFEKIGWKGVCIEPDPEMAEKCNENRKCVVARFAIGPQIGSGPFFVNEQDKGLSGLNRPGKPITVTLTRLERILSQLHIPFITVLSIDTEGTELDVWATRGEYQPQVVIIEYQTCEEPPQDFAIRERLEQDGYHLVRRTVHNLIFVLDDPAPKE